MAENRFGIIAFWHNMNYKIRSFLSKIPDFFYFPNQEEVIYPWEDAFVNRVFYWTLSVIHLSCKINSQEVYEYVFYLCSGASFCGGLLSS